MWDDYNTMVTIPHCNCGLTCASLIAATKLIQDQQLMQFLVGLNDDNKVIRGSILMMKPLPNIDQVYQLIIQEEKQRSLSAMTQINSSAAAFNVNNSMISQDCSAMAAQHKVYKDGLPASSIVSTPLPLNCILEPEKGEFLSDPTYYRALVGNIIFLTHTRPDLSFTARH